VAQGWSAWKVREQSGTSGRQFGAYARWGLIQPFEDGSWAPETIELVAAIEEAREHARQLDRRTVWLRRDYLKFPVPNNKLREAMISIAGSRSISSPRRKISLVLRLWEEQSRPRADSAIRRAHREPTRVRRLPAPDTWKAILRNRNVTDEVFGAQASHAYLLDHQFAESIPGWAAAMPLEERVVIILVLNLSPRPRP
jgi:hypothetical protein